GDAAAASGCHPGDTTFQRASYVVSSKQRTMHVVGRRSGVRFRTPFARYWLSGFLADIGDGVRLAAFPLLAAEFTRSATAVAAVAAVQGLPWLVLGAGLGVLVDRTDRRRLMMAVDLARAAIIAALAAAILTHSAGMVLICLTAFITGTGSAL